MVVDTTIERIENKVASDEDPTEELKQVLQVSQERILPFDLKLKSITLFITINSPRSQIWPDQTDKSPVPTLLTVS